MEHAEPSAHRQNRLMQGTFVAALVAVLVSIPLELIGSLRLASGARVVFYLLWISFEVAYFIRLLRHRASVGESAMALVLTLGYFALDFMWGRLYG